MNKQKKGAGIEWTHVYGPGTGYTWNPIGGCMHDCKWIMPDGQVAQCYAKSVAEGVASAAYPHGFEAHYWTPERLQEPMKLKQPAGIFLDSMSDLMGRWVKDEQIRAVLRVARLTPQHTYFLLTKNAPRLVRFNFPPNVWVGVSSPPDYMWGKELTTGQRLQFLDSALRYLGRTDAAVKWMSFEPLTISASPTVHVQSGVLDWAVIGAASNGRNEYAPSEDLVWQLVRELDRQDVPVFFKGNMRSLPWAVANWRQAFPRQDDEVR